jgi:hypothetical protein
MGEGDAGCDSVSPRSKDRRLAQVRKFSKYLKRGLLKHIVCKVEANEPGDVATQRLMNVAEELLQGGPIAGLGKKHEQCLIARFDLLRLHALKRRRGVKKVRFSR